MLKRVIAAVILTAFVGMLVGCNTVEGFGQDTQKAGKKIERAADEHK